MSWSEVRQVFGVEKTRRQAVQRLLPLGAAALAMLLWAALRHDKDALFGTLVAVGLVAPFWIHDVATSIVRPPTLKQTVRRIALTWAVLIGTWCALYLVVLR